MNNLLDYLLALVASCSAAVVQAGGQRYVDWSVSLHAVMINLFVHFSLLSRFMCTTLLLKTIWSVRSAV